MGDERFALNKGNYWGRTYLRIQGFKDDLWNWVGTELIWDKIVKDPPDDQYAKSWAYLQRLKFGRVNRENKFMNQDCEIERT